MRKTMLRIIFAIAVLCLISGCNDENSSSNVEYVHVGPNWDAVHNLPPSDKTFKVKIKTSQKIKEGETLKFSVNSEKKGELWIVQVDPEDRVTLLYPNEADKNNTIEKTAWVSIPADDKDYEIAAGKPYGKSTIAVIVTTRHTDLDDVLGAMKNMSKALVLLETEPSWGIGHVVVDVTP